MNYTEEQIKEIFGKLPKDVQSAITSVSVADELQKIGEKYRLHMDKIDELFDETTLVMLGLTHPKDYLKNLEQRLEIPEDLAREIVSETNESIFKPIRESLKKIHSIETAGSELKPGETYVPAEPAQVQKQEKTLNSEDRKIFAESGIQMESPTGTPVAATEEIIPPKSNLLETIENPASAPEEKVSMASGFTVTPQPKTPSSSIVISPDQKLTAPVKSSPLESAYTTKDAGAVPIPSSLPAQKNVDPYREPIS